MKRHIAWIALSGLLLAACSSGPAAAPVSAPVSAPVPPPAPAPPAAKPGITITDWAPAAPELVLEPAPLTGDTPLYTPDPIAAPPPDPLAGRSPAADKQALLLKLAENLRATKKPDVPDDLPAAFLTMLEGGYYVYDLGRRGEAPYRDIYMIDYAHEDGWLATPICKESGWHVRAFEHNGHPYLFCSAVAGSYGLVSLNTLYKEGKEIFRGYGLSPGNGVEFVLDPNVEVPTLRLSQYRAMYGVKGGFHVTGRYTVVWQDGKYVPTKFEYQANREYYLARFLAFLKEGGLEKAADTFAAAPPGGVRAYVEQSAPDLLKGDVTFQFPERPYKEGRAYFRTGDPFTPAKRWIWFEFAPDGKVVAIGEEAP